MNFAYIRIVLLGYNINMAIQPRYGNEVAMIF